MIYTLTMNPAIDFNITGKDIKKNFVNRTWNPVYTPNGKGVNVSLVLKHFGYKSVVMGFFGGFSGKYIVDELERANIDVQPVWVDDVTRINIFLNDGSDEYKFVNKGAFVSYQNQQELLQRIQALTDCEYLSISGSLPPGIDEDYYDEIAQICREKNIKLILDISSPHLKELLKYKPFLIKPNDDEVKQIFGYDVISDDTAVVALKALTKQGARNVLLTMGSKGAYFTNGRDVYFSTAQKIKLLSSACAGDSALAAFLSEFLYEGSIEEALKKSAATGANVAESNALGEMEKVEEYMNHIQIIKKGKIK
ncbi:1-phosphofructokinase [Pectinatus cerevisiiphilus]|uniref:Tagatose-6-phosphate kinase n=1 Tax=Pectinatus cerevisiiphilus TaxID=86956 RepID=A0A4R3KFH8_9FIRM|nr:1-phosphofructokinase [Pectinatus cerevisiiphilus]TCS81950.1 1-phosphofructokinase/6-phosphofructokinase 2 [Pectinatus cerevisiiphilus]